MRHHTQLSIGFLSSAWDTGESELHPEETDEEAGNGVACGLGERLRNIHFVCRLLLRNVTEQGV